MCESNNSSPSTTGATENSEHPTIDLNSLRNGHPKAVKVATDRLRNDGFVFLSFEGDDLSQFDSLLQQAGDYLHNHGRGKGQGPSTSFTGHISSRYKDSFSLVTGDELPSSMSKVPSELKDIERLFRALDDAAKEVVSVLAHPLFGLSSEDALNQAGKVFDIPLLNSSADTPLGMVDLVCYHNDQDLDMDDEEAEFVVAEHIDPGLLILSLPQSSPGLELLKSSSKGRTKISNGALWVSPPPRCGVLWAGKRATEHGLCRPGIHRVSRGSEPRTSCWHELCTSDQLSKPLLDKLKERGYELAIGDIKGTPEVIKMLCKAEEHDAEAVDFVKFAQISHGVPISKIESGRFEVTVVKGTRSKSSSGTLVNRMKAYFRKLTTCSK